MKKPARPEKNELEALTGKVIGCAMKIHRVLGYGFNMNVYKHALSFELHKMALQYQRDKDIAVFYEGVKTGVITVDFIVNDTIIVTTTALAQLDVSQIPHESLLQAVKAEAGLLLNFGTSKLEFATTNLSNK